MDKENLNILSNAESQPVIRSTFLTVLCILTFMASLWNLISYTSEYLNADVSSSFVNQNMDEVKRTIDDKLAEKDPEMANKINSDIDKVADPETNKKNALVMIISNLLTLAGAVMMFQLKKAGFWIYIVGTVIGIIGPLLVFGIANLFANFMAIIISIFGILFIVLYSRNLKQLR
jgi:hypothetical protein